MNMKMQTLLKITVGLTALVASSTFAFPSTTYEATVISDCSSPRDCKLFRGDILSTSEKSRAGLPLNNGMLFLGSNTDVKVISLSSHFNFFYLIEGAVSLRILENHPRQMFQIKSGDTVISMRQAGYYRINASPNGRTTTIQVLAGNAVVRIGKAIQTVKKGEILSYNVHERAVHRKIASPLYDEQYYFTLNFMNDYFKQHAHHGYKFQTRSQSIRGPKVEMITTPTQVIQYEEPANTYNKPIIIRKKERQESQPLWQEKSTQESIKPENLSALNLADGEAAGGAGGASAGSAGAASAGSSANGSSMSTGSTTSTSTNPSTSEMPSDETPTTMPNTGSPTTMPNNGSPTTMPSDQSPTTMPSDQSPTTMPNDGTPSTMPEQDSIPASGSGGSASSGPTGDAGGYPNSKLPDSTTLPADPNTTLPDSTLPNSTPPDSLVPNPKPESSMLDVTPPNTSVPNTSKPNSSLQPQSSLPSNLKLAEFTPLEDSLTQPHELRGFDSKIDDPKNFEPKPSEPKEFETQGYKTKEFKPKTLEPQEMKHKTLEPQEMRDPRDSSVPAPLPEPVPDSQRSLTPRDKALEIQPTDEQKAQQKEYDRQHPKGEPDLH